MNLRLIITLIMGISLGLGSCNGTDGTSEEPLKKYVHVPPVMPDSVYAKLKDGDIILRKGSGPLSFHIMNATKEEYSHCGIIVKEEDEWRVIHSIGGSVSKDEEDGVQQTDLVNFVKFASDSMLFICRPIFADSIGTKIKDRAYYYLDQATPFDHSFNLFTRDEIYCSELLFYILRDITGKNQFKIRKQHKSYILLFETFFDTEKYQPIFHLKDLAEN